MANTHSWLNVSNGNPFSEAQFKTVVYHPSRLERFGSLEDLGRERGTSMLTTRLAALRAAYHAHPEPLAL